MNLEVLEISGYVPAICSLYMSKRTLNEDRLTDIINTVNGATDKRGFIIADSPYRDKLYDYLSKAIRYGIRFGHHQILKFIDVTIYMQGLHRGAQDDYDAHAARMNIIRSSTRSVNGAQHSEFSEFYNDKLIPFKDLKFMPEVLVVENEEYVKTTWGYVKSGHETDGDVLRGLTPLGLASDNISKVAYGEHLRHIYSVRRMEGHANPELKKAMELLRSELYTKCFPLGEYLGKVWVEDDNNEGHYMEEPDTKRVSK